MHFKAILPALKYTHLYTMTMPSTVFVFICIATQGMSQIVRLSNCSICDETFRVVSSCPANAKDYTKASKRCSPYRVSSHKQYELHCVRNTRRTKLIEVCAVPSRLFGYCPQYDSVGHVIQMDLSVECNATSGLIYYNSSDSFLCNTICFQLELKTTTENNNTQQSVTDTPDNKKNKMPTSKNENGTLVIVAVSFPLIIIICVYIYWYKKRRHKDEDDPEALDLRDLEDNLN
nr:uncharacterized protein LOC111105431 isoform X2 [Crassostrea virginica]XP_022295432.1 uncharacterized protein LOC111105431 isoform X2 [Crassostrea virginica]